MSRPTSPSPSAAVGPTRRIRKTQPALGPMTPILARRARNPLSSLNTSPFFAGRGEQSRNNVSRFQNSEVGDSRLLDLLMPDASTPLGRPAEKQFSVPPLFFEETLKKELKGAVNPFNSPFRDPASPNPFSSPANRLTTSQKLASSANKSYVMIMSPAFQTVKVDRHPPACSALATPVSLGKSAATEFNHSFVDADLEMVSRQSRKPKLDGFPKLCLDTPKKLVIMPL